MFEKLHDLDWFKFQLMLKAKQTHTHIQRLSHTNAPWKGNQITFRLAGHTTGGHWISDKRISRERGR